MVDKIGVRVDSEELIALLQCSVCCSEYVNPVLTKCGHNFCLDCIEECISRNHECPECKRRLVREELCKNIQVARLQRQIQELRAKAKNEIVENILALESGFGNNRNLVLAILQDSLKDQIARFEQYCENAKKDCENAKRKLKSKYSSLAASKQADPQAKLAQEKELTAADERFAMIINYHLRIYSDYIQKAFIGPELLPIVLSVHVTKKNVTFDPVFVAPNKPLQELRTVVEKAYKGRDPIVKWAFDLCYVLTDPLTKTSTAVPRSEEAKTLRELKVLHGTRVELKGDLLWESDIPKPCVTLNFRAEDKRAFDYFSCETCALNWVCEPCIQQCHKGHSYKSHMKDHVPTWACCYCLKKECKLPNKKNQAGSIVAIS
eukprot:TRINITY_DN956_c0_g1_i1.p1 TRINITY_DN956_c0_g1~~TRINITY_DN956_c0_g1_i1.p1  ORF type:complete len:377 (-),score=114.85 TRINITY_DN956_c0_g1_i1:132-1262(-)